MYVWRFFNSSLRILAQMDLKTIEFKEMCKLLQSIGNVYDTRTMKNYIDCMITNKWVTEDNSENPLNPNSLLTNPESPLYNYANSNNCIAIYKNTKFHINKDAQYDSVQPKDILEQYIRVHQK